MILFGNADGTNFCFNKGLVDHDEFSNNTNAEQLYMNNCSRGVSFQDIFPYRVYQCFVGILGNGKWTIYREFVGTVRIGDFASAHQKGVRWQFTVEKWENKLIKKTTAEN